MQQAFDTIAKDYDASFTHSIIGKAQRQIVWSYLEKFFLDNKKLNVLELNCGTGEDALRFAERGHRVLATDISGKMLEITKAKINESALSSLINTKQLDLNTLDKINDASKFDMVFSNFGGMNCLSNKEMTALPTRIRKVLNENGNLIMIIMTDFCLWETIYFLFKLNFKAAFRRFSANGVVTNLNGNELKTYYFSPHRIKRIFRNDFDVISIRPVGIFIPPSYLNNFFSGKKNLLKILIKLEQNLSRFGFLSGLSDHFFIHLRVKK